MKKITFRRAALAALCTGAILFTGCGGGGSKSAQDAVSGGPGEPMYAEAAAAPAFAPAGGAFYENGSDSNYSEGYDDAAYEMEAAPIPEQEYQEYDAPAAAAMSKRKLIRTVDIVMETDDFDSLLTRIKDRIGELGGYVEESSVTGREARLSESVPRNARMTARIPSDRLDTFLSTVEEQANILRRSENTQDVTLQYSDMESKKKSLTIEQERIWELLEKADSLDAVIMLEDHLSEIRYELESMESKLRLIDNHVDYSTVTLEIEEVTIFTPTAPESVGQQISSAFSHSLRNMSDFCVGLFILIVGTTPVWVPILLLAAALWFFARRRRQKRENGAVSPDGTNDPSDGIKKSEGGRFRFLNKKEKK
ncbi:DUF4349 domain-containing protein [Otoolea muris]|uniref:DUF4349 domain-containing protein n=1 Tax=Otoolea muris TaxID=2941515 RepID=UPI00203B79DC|nr:DUF4349 domain-containing protein [Otoolea muris]